MRRAPTALLAIGLLIAFATAGVAHGELSANGNILVSLDGAITPKDLPRHQLAPVTVSVQGGIKTFNGDAPPPLQKIVIAINRHGILFNQGLPTCPAGRLESTTSVEALRRCRSSLVGHGGFDVNVALPQISQFPAHGRLLAFNGVRRGKPVILAHIYGATPVPTTFVLPFTITHKPTGTFGTVLTTKLPPIAANWGYVTNLELTIHRVYSFGGQRRSFLSANCPVPGGLSGAAFAFARGTYTFFTGQKLTTTLSRQCRVRG